MKQLRFTTTAPHSMFEFDDKPLSLPDEIGEIIYTNVKGRTAYIHSDAEDLAGFDIPIILDGDMGQFDLPVDEQDILMLLPTGEYKCKAVYETDVISDCYLITLK